MPRPFWPRIARRFPPGKPAIVTLIATLVAACALGAGQPASPAQPAPAPPAQPPAASPADPTADLLARLQAIPALPGYEDTLRAALVAELPGWSEPKVEEPGSLVVDLGGQGPPRLVAAPLDEPGYVVTEVDTAGYLRVSRLAGWGRLYDQFHVGQRFLVLTERGPMAAVSAAPSVHLRGRAATQSEPLTVADLWLDLGFHSRSEAVRAGVQILDAVTLVERHTPLAGGRAAGPGLMGRAELVALLRALLGSRPQTHAHWIAAFTAQAQPGGRGLRRLIRRFDPSEVYVLGGFPRGSLGRGFVVQSDSLKGLDPDLTRKLVRLAGNDGQRGSRAFAPDLAGLDALGRTPAAVLGLPVRYAHTSAEIVDAADVASLAAFLRRLMEAP